MLSNNARTRIIEAAKVTARGYLALDLVKSFKFGEQTLQDIIIAQTKDIEIDSSKKFTVKLAGTSLELTIARTTDGVTASFAGKHNAEILPPADYTAEQAAALLASQQYTFTFDENNQPITAITLNHNDQQWAIGGKGKLDLYRTHIITLMNMIKHLSEGKDLASMLIALTTGSGKTFIQALWALTLRMANVNAVFSMPDEGGLSTQLINDFRMLLPDALVDEMRTAEVVDGKSNLADMPKDAGQIFIAPHEVLFEEPAHYAALMAQKGSDIAISVDEQHKVMTWESTRLKLSELAKNFISVFLTATPTPDTYAWSGKKPVAVMSNVQKKKAGQGQIPEYYQFEARDGAGAYMTDSSRERHRLEDKARNNLGRRKPLAVRAFDFITRSTELTALGIYGTIVSAFAPYKTSAAITLVQKMNHYFKVKKPGDMYYYEPKDDSKEEKRKAMRWNVQFAAQRKMIIGCDSSDELVNLKRKFSDPYSSDVCFGGTLHPSYDDSTISHLGSVERKRAIEQLEEEFPGFSQIAPVGYYYDESDISNPLSSVQRKNEQLEQILFHNMVDLTISHVTGLSVVELNKRRFENLDGLKELFEQRLQDKFGEMSSDEIKAHLTKKLTFGPENKKGVDKESAEKIASVMKSIIVDYKYVNDRLNNSNYKSSTTKEQIDWQLRLIDNWRMDHKLLKVLLLAGGLRELREHCGVLINVHGMQDAKVRIQDNNPVRAFTKWKVKLRNEDGSLSEAARRLDFDKEILLRGDNAELTTFEPEYLFGDDILASDRVAVLNNLFKLGAVAVLAGNTHSEGFSDLNLHTAFSLIQHSTDAMNRPDKVVQHSGRLRGLDPTEVPITAQVASGKAQIAFDTDALATKDDFLPDYFASFDKFKRTMLKSLGNDLADAIRAKTLELKGEGAADSKELHKAVMANVINVFRKINNFNEHNIKLSRSDLRAIIGYARENIREEIKQKKNPKLLSTIQKVAILVFGALAKLITFAMNAVSRLNHYWARIKRWWSKPKETADEAIAHSIYFKVLSKTSLARMAGFNLSKAIQFNKLMQSKMAATENAIKEAAYKAGLGNATEEQVMHFVKNLFKKQYDKNVMPVILSDFYKENLNAHFSFLSKEEINWLVKKSELEGIDADKLFRFIGLVVNNKRAELLNEFATLDAEAKGPEDLPILKYMGAVEALIPQVKAVHQYYNDNSANPMGFGEPVYYNADAHPKDKDGKPLAFTGHPADLVKERDVVLAHCSRDVLEVREAAGFSMAKMIINAANMVNDLNWMASLQKLEDSGTTGYLEHAERHILRPLWWTCDRTSFSAKCINAGRRAYFRMRKRFESKPEKADFGTTDVDIDRSADDAAVQVGRTISELRAFGISDVAKATGVTDCLTSLSKKFAPKA